MERLYDDELNTAKRMIFKKLYRERKVIETRKRKKGDSIEISVSRRE